MTADSCNIPAKLLPADGRFGSGPSKVRPAQVEALARAGATVLGTSHRQAPVKHLIGRIREGLKELFALPAGYDVVLGLGGATAFWDAAIFGLVRHRAAAFTYGEFSQKFANILGSAPWLEAPLVRSTKPGAAPDPFSDPVPATEADAVCWAHNETSTGAMAPIGRPSANQLVLIDATSAAGGLPIDVTDTDAYYFSPQKCFGADGGLWVALLSPAALERIDAIAASGRYVPAFLDLQTAVRNSRKEQTYNTPPTAGLVLLAEQVEWMLAQGGLDAMTRRTQQSADILYSWAENRPETTPFVSPAAARSHTVGTIDLHTGVDAALLTDILRRNGILDVNPYRKLGRNQIRVGLFPSIDPRDVELLTHSIDYVLDSGCVASQNSGSLR